MIVVGRQGQIGLRRKEMIEASLPDSGLFADLLDPDAAEAVRPDEIERCLKQSFPCITGASHGLFMAEIRLIPRAWRLLIV